MPRLPRLHTVRTLLFFGLAGISPIAAYAADSGSFTSQQRQEIVEIMRQALKTDPSILSDAIMALRQGAQVKAETDALSHVRSDREKLQTAPEYAVRGNAQGDLTVVEFLDPRCGYCRSLVPVVDKLIASDPKLRFVEKIIPVLSEKSVMDAQAILAAAKQGGYDKMKRGLMQDTAVPTLDRIREIAAANGLNADRLVKDMHDQDISALINENLSQAREIGLDGTPTFVFGTASIAPGAMSLDDLRSRVREARASGKD